MLPFLLVSFLGMAEPQTAACTPGGSASIKLTPIFQDCPQWCWAATTKMILGALGKTDVLQCKEANQEFGLNTCCSAKPDPTCCHGGWPEVDRDGFQVTIKAGDNNVMSQDLIKQQIACRQVPFAHSWKWPGDNGGHMILVFGYHTDRAGALWLETIDPDGPLDKVGHPTAVVGMISYDVYVHGPKPGARHWKDFYDVRK